MKYNIGFLSLIATVCVAWLAMACSSNNHSNEYQQKAIEAKHYYDAEQYSKAIEAMQQAVALANPAKPSFAEMYNLGNAYYRKGDLASATLYYLRAKRISPSNKAVNHNLMIVASRTIDRLDYTPPLSKQIEHNICYALPTAVVYGLSLLFILLVVMGSLLYVFAQKRSIRKLGFYSGVVALLLFIFAVVVLMKQKNDYYNTTEAVITVGKSAIKSEPKNDAITLFQLNEASRVIITNRPNNSTWYQIILPDGKEGWIQASDITQVYPFNSK